MNGRLKFLHLMLQRVVCSTKFRRVCSAKFLRVNFAPAFVAFAIFAALAWLSGLSDFLFEENFCEFRWPPYGDLRKQVVEEMTRSTRWHFANPNNASTSDETRPTFNHFIAPLIRPSCRRNRFTRRRFLLIVVKSAPHRFDRRDAIRATYGAVAEESGFRLHVVFVMGRPDVDVKPDDGGGLHDEAARHGDLIVGDFVDAYRNGTHKFLAAIDFARSYCGDAMSAERVVPYLFLVDDDYLVSPRNLVGEARRHVAHDRLYMGGRVDSSPFRLVFQKHRVSLAEYPFAAYPPYITGGAVLLTAQTIKEFHTAVKYSRLFPLDDVYAGILAHLLGINALHNENFCVNAPGGGGRWTWRELYNNDDAPADAWRTRVAMHGVTPARLVAEWHAFVRVPAV